MSRRVTLVALWAVFAVASVSVGFAAASMVSDPFTDVDTTSEVSALAGPAGDPFSGPSPTADPTGTASPSPTQKPTKTPSSNSTKPPSNSSAAVKRGISTRGGYVSATCRDGLVSVGAAPALYWRVDSWTAPRARTGRVRLEPAQDANGERVEVTATCASSGIPAFTTDYQDGGGDGGGGDDGGGDDGGGSGHGGGGGDGNSGGSDGSSGSGSGQ